MEGKDAIAQSSLTVLRCCRDGALALHFKNNLLCKPGQHPRRSFAYIAQLLQLPLFSTWV